MLRFEKSCKEVVSTGGPSAGKSDGMAVLSEELQDKGFDRVFVAPEGATLYCGYGIRDLPQLAKSNRPLYFEVERCLLGAQLELEARYHQFASLFPEDRCVLLLDRGAMDIRAYLDDDEFERLLKEENLDRFDVRDRYDVVNHLVTAAIGAQEHYTCANNRLRSEGLETARVLDKRIQDAWTGRTHLNIIDNSTDFEGKMCRVVQATLRGLGVPVPIETERKFLLRGMPNFRSLGVHVQAIDIEQQYLVPSAEGELRIRRRSQGNTNVYYRTNKKKREGSQFERLEYEDIITEREYQSLSMFRDPSARLIRKIRFCFIYDYQYFELDVFIEPDGLFLLELELTEENAEFRLPPFLDVVKDVTDDVRYTNAAIARGRMPR